MSGFVAEIKNKAKAEEKVVCDCIGAFLSITKQPNGEHAIGDSEFLAWNERRSTEWVKVSDVEAKLKNYMILKRKQLEEQDLDEYFALQMVRNIKKDFDESRKKNPNFCDGFVHGFREGYNKRGKELLGLETKP